MSLLVSCSVGECLDNTSSIPLAGLYSDSTETSVTVDSISVYGIGAPGDSIMLNNASGIYEVYLPLRLDNGGVTQYVFHYNQSAVSDNRYNDTLTLKYKELPYFESYECGAMYYFQIEEFGYTQNIFDSVAVTDSLITNVNTESIKIFLKTNSTE